MIFTCWLHVLVRECSCSTSYFTLVDIMGFKDEKYNIKEPLYRVYRTVSVCMHRTQTIHVYILWHDVVNGNVGERDWMIESQSCWAACQKVRVSHFSAFQTLNDLAYVLKDQNRGKGEGSLSWRLRPHRCKCVYYLSTSVCGCVCYVM